MDKYEGRANGGPYSGQTLRNSNAYFYVSDSYYIWTNGEWDWKG